jgi:glycosyltransferase involved in cell wall biosynthesis
MSVPQFSIHISTNNRIKDLIYTLDKISKLLDNDEVECIVYDDGSSDGTSEFIKKNYPNIKLLRNQSSKGYLFCRNKMLSETKAEFAISLDDDAHFVSENPLEYIQSHFEKNLHCGLIALRIFWGLKEPSSIDSKESSCQVKGFVGCAHVWRMKAWRDIPNYPEWFVFYGEEDFASYQLFKKSWQVHYLPEILVNHRVDVIARKNNIDYTTRLRRSLRSGWYLFFMFYPISKVARKMAYSIWIQFKLKVIKGDFKAMRAIILALLDLVSNIPRILKNSKRLTMKEYEEYQKLTETKLYWNPENEQK